MKRLILVHNPNAGDGKPTAEELTALLRGGGFRVAYVDAKDKGRLKALRRARGLIVAAGGDGTVHKVARRIAGCGKTMAVLPLGTANNIARSLGIRGTPAELAPRLKRAKTIAIDVGVAAGPWGRRIFIEGAGGGLFAEVMARLDSGRVRRRKRRAANGDGKTLFSRDEAHLAPSLHALAELLPAYKAKALDVAIDGARISGKFLLLEAMNMPYLGPNLHLGRDADPADGLLDFVLLSEERRQEFAGYLRHRLEGGKDAPHLTVVKGKRLRCAWRGSKLHIDDKIALTGTGNPPPEIEVAVMPRAIRLLVPHAAAAVRARPSFPRAARKAKPRRGRPLRRVRRD